MSELQEAILRNDVHRVILAPEDTTATSSWT